MLWFEALVHHLEASEVRSESLHLLRGLESLHGFGGFNHGQFEGGVGAHFAADGVLERMKGAY